MTTVRLSGLHSQPLSNYLAALGVLRTVGTQFAASVAGRWVVDSFEVQGVDKEKLVRFLVDDFAPSPIFSPWNKEGDPAQNSTTRNNLVEIVESEHPRFDSYQRVLNSFQRSSSVGWTDLTKQERLAWWRSNAPEDALPWLDATFVLGAGDEPSFPPLLGTGGNDGRFEFSRLLHGQLIRLFINSKTMKLSEGWLRNLLFGEPGPALVDETMGSYNSDATGTPNSAASGSAKSATNPWEIVLLFEGLLALAGSVSSRMGYGRTRAMSAPFMVRPAMVGTGEAGDEEARGELWAPIWSEFVRFRELQHLLGEGRLEWNGKQARTNVDAARAVASLGSDRGLDAFERFNLVKRNGLSYVAVPSGRVGTQTVPGVSVLSQVDQWVSRVRRFGSTSASIARALREFDRSQLRVVAEGGAPSTYLDVLVTLSDLERAVGRNRSARNDIRPFPFDRGGKPVLNIDEWWCVLAPGATADVDPVLVAALGLASLHQSPRGPSVPFPSMSAALRGLSARYFSSGTLSVDWDDRDDNRDIDAMAANQAGSLVAIEVLTRRLMAAVQVPPSESESLSGVKRAAYGNGCWVPLDCVSRLVDGYVEADEVLRVARGLAMLSGWEAFRMPISPASSSRAPINPWFAAVRLSIADARTQVSVDLGDGPQAITLPLAPRSWGRQLAAGRLDGIGVEAAARLRRSGHPAPRQVLAPGAVSSNAVTIALLLRLSDYDIGRLSRSISPFQSTEYSIMRGNND